MNLLQRLGQLAIEQGDHGALSDGTQRLNYVQLVNVVERLARQLRATGLHSLGLQIDNGLAWVILDLAALSAGLCLVPLPPFFSTSQRQHVLEQAQVQAIITDQPDSFSADWANIPLKVWDFKLSWLEAFQGSNLSESVATATPPAIPLGIAKVTFTSGTTGTPKGVMLGWQHIAPVLESLLATTALGPDDRHLVLLPLAVLLENLAGVYAPLWAGATVIVPALAEVGLSGSSRLDSAQMRDALIQHQATTAIFTPQTLQALVEQQERQSTPLDQLRFAAVGGAPVSPRLLARAQACDIPVYEGYGLSECSSVVSLNSPQANKPGSVGKPLPHVRVEISADGEVLIHSSGFAGYLGDAQIPAQPWRSGDLGHLDADGYLFLTGRRRNVFITAFGRNVAPEWVERELTLEPAIAQAALIGEAKPWNLALIVPHPDSDPETINAAIERVNKNLPDYAQVRHWTHAEEPFTPTNGLLTGTGRLRREALHERYRHSIIREYENNA